MEHDGWVNSVLVHCCFVSFLYSANISLRTHNSSLEGATKLKFAPFCSSRDALSDDMLFCLIPKFQILAENHGL